MPLNHEHSGTTIDAGDAWSLKHGEARKFEFADEAVSRAGFVVRVGDAFHAYENRCRHLPLPLDLGTGRFFTADGVHLVCSSHGAVYEPETGLCTRGPCQGASLRRLPVAVVNGRLLVTTRS